MKYTFAFKKKIDPDAYWYVKVSEWSVQKWTKSEYYHVEVFFDGFWYGIGTKGIHKFPVRPLSDKYDYVTLEIETSKKQLELIRTFFNIETKYDWKGIIFSQFLPMGINSVENWFCSEYLAKMLQILLVETLLFVHPHMISPQGLYVLIQNLEERVDDIELNSRK